MASDVRLTDGQFDFSGGVDSSRVPLFRSELNPRGLQRNQLAWANNATMRTGGILQRTGWQPVTRIHDGNALYQGGWMYDNFAFGGNPYLMLSIGGRMIQVRTDLANQVVDITGIFQDPIAQPQAYFCQEDQFMVKQAGDGATLPLFWDGISLRRSHGITGNLTGSNINELPAATCMVGYMGRIWYAQNRKAIAGDIIGNQSSGTLPYQFKDSVLKVTENPLAIGGDGFSVPGTAGNIRALNYPIALDTALGQGPLFIFTPKQIYALTVPVTRTDWIGADNNNQPLMRVVMNNNGAVSDRSVVPANGDLFFQSLDPSIRSFFMSLRYFKQWGNAPISNNINRVMEFNDRSLMRFSSGINFGSRLLQAIRPVQTSVGVCSQAIAVLDLDPLSTLQEQDPPAWDGIWEGLDVLQLFTGDFGGRERAFAVVKSRIDGSIELWELTNDQRFENGDNRIEWYVEFPATSWDQYPRAQGGGPFELKDLDGFTLWVDKVFGEVTFTLQYRPDEDQCWYDWDTTEICAARTCEENPDTPHCYPVVGAREQYRVPINWPKPKGNTCSIGNKRPSTLGFKHQIKLSVKGWCRIRGYHIHAVRKDIGPYASQIC